jgi:S1-C subfamily serine protease
MNLLDIFILILVALAAVHGLRLGAAVQIASFTGFVVGLLLGVLLVLLIEPHIHNSLDKAVVALVLLFLPACLLGGTGRTIGVHLWRSMRTRGNDVGNRLAPIDAGAGLVLAVAGTLVLCWLSASVLVNSQFQVVSNQIENSSVIRALDRVMPPVPNSFQSVERFLASEGFPVVFANLVPEPTGPVTLPGEAQLHQAVRIDGASVVRVLGYGCGGIQQEGSGFVVAPGLVVTNAHVVAGISQITVEVYLQGSHAARVIYFDPDFDLAVLRVNGPVDEPPLHLDPNLVERGQQAVVMGYPEDGPFDAQAAGVLERYEASGYDIYGTGQVTRTVYELESLVRPGNSGGPLVEPGGEVIGVVFSRNASTDTIGYALASPGVLSRVQYAEHHPTNASTGRCIGS